MCILVGARRRPAGSGEYFRALPACGRGHVHSARGSIVRVGLLQVYAPLWDMYHTTQAQDIILHPGKQWQDLCSGCHFEENTNTHDLLLPKDS